MAMPSTRDAVVADAIAKVKTLSGQLAQLRAENDGLRDTIDDLRKTIAEMQAEIDYVSKDNDRLFEQLTDAVVGAKVAEARIQTTSSN